MPNTKKKILLIGETWMSSASHFKGFDQFGSVTFHSGAEPLVKALAGTPFELIHMPAHEAIEKLPFDLQGLMHTMQSCFLTSAQIHCCSIPMSGCAENPCQTVSSSCAIGRRRVEGSP